jgi:hypothetical protein
MNPIIPEEPIDMQLRLQWPLICRTACRAMILKMTFEEVVYAAMKATAS